MGILFYGTSKVNLTNGEIAKKSRSYFWYASVLYWTTIEIKKPIYSETAAYGHMGRTQKPLLKHFLPRWINKNSYCWIIYLEKLRFCRPSKTAFDCKINLYR
jgi:S-adenosylmethionine synthetase